MKQLSEFDVTNLQVQLNQLEAETKGYIKSAQINSVTNSIELFTGNDTTEPTFIIALPKGFSGDYNDLANKPVLFSEDYNDLKNKPELFSGDYEDLKGTPILFDGNYNSLSNKPILFDGDYDGLSNKPDIYTKTETGEIVDSAFQLAKTSIDEVETKVDESAAEIEKLKIEKWGIFDEMPADISSYPDGFLFFIKE